jgi:TIGR03009 family protein
MAHLNGWEKVMKGATNFYAECSLKRNNLLLKKETEYTGTVMCMKPNLARMRIDKKPAAGQKQNPNDFEAYICTGQAVYQYDGNAQQVTEHKLPNGGVGGNLLLEFMSGNITAAQAVARFDVKTLKQDQHYVYLDIRPRTDRDKGDFEAMTLVLFQPTVPGMGYLPRTVVMRKPLGQEEEVWDFPRPAVNVPKGIEKEHFQFVKPVDGWKFQPDTRQPAAPAPGQPRVARPMGP